MVNELVGYLSEECLECVQHMGAYSKDQMDGYHSRYMLDNCARKVAFTCGSF